MKAVKIAIATLGIVSVYAAAFGPKSEGFDFWTKLAAGSAAATVVLASVFLSSYYDKKINTPLVAVNCAR